MGSRERRARSNERDRELSALLIKSLDSISGSISLEGIAIAAVGGYGRGELSPGSDLDILIVHQGQYPETMLNEIVNALLYPLWDQGIKVDYSVRTRSETRATARLDIRVALGLLDLRIISGDARLLEAIANDAREDWRTQSTQYLLALRQAQKDRHKRSGELAYLLEPDLKEARGGLRDASTLRALQTSGLVDVALEKISQAESLLMNVRDALHLSTGKDKDRLFFIEQDRIALDLGFKDADALMGAVAHAARSIDYCLEITWNRIDHKKKGFLAGKKSRSREVTLGKGVRVIADEVTFDVDASDPFLAIRAAALAAQHGLPLSIESSAALAEVIVDQGTGVWPREARENLVALIGAGQSMIPVWETLDQEELLFHWLPEWREVRSLPQRNVLHRHTVDRHMVETAVCAAALTRRVHRPDLLLISALFHDIGKGDSEDHSIRGERLIAPLVTRLGFPLADIETIQLLVRHHLLLPATASRRDLNDPATISTVLSVVPDIETLELLHALSIADGEATGRAAWTDWKAGLVSDLVSRVKAAMSGNTIARQPEFSDEQIAIAHSGVLTVKIEDRGNEFAIEIISPDKPGLLSIVSGVLHLARLDVRSAHTLSYGTSAVMKWIVQPAPHSQVPHQEKLQKEVEAAILDSSSLESRINERIAAYAQYPSIPVPPPEIEIFDDAATFATVIEIRSHDKPALLFNIGSAITRCQIDIRSAIVTTLGAEAIDTLYVTEISGGALSPVRALQVSQRLAQILR